MKSLLALAAAVSLGCALPRNTPQAIPISVSSHNRSSVDVYLLCGDRAAQWLGVVRAKDGALFEIPVSRANCVRGLNFFLVHRDRNRGYWVGPVRAGSGSSVHLTIEKYAALSMARVDNWR